MFKTHLVALLNHHLLSQEDLLCRDLHAQVSSRNHDGIGLLQNVIKVLDALLILHFADNLDLPAPGSQDLDNAHYKLYKLIFSQVAHRKSLTHASAHEHHQNTLRKGILSLLMH